MKNYSHQTQSSSHLPIAKKVTKIIKYLTERMRECRQSFNATLPNFTCA